MLTPVTRQEPHMPTRIRHLPTAIVLLLAVALIVHGPIAQLPHYHDFADHAAFLGVPHAGDVLSNAGFALVALWGLWRLFPQRAHPALARAWPGYLLFLLALMLTAAGSGYYHLAPDNARLLWDRLPIALACAGLLAAARADNVPRTRCARDALVLAVCAVASVAWWTITDRVGQGDLRPYLLLQGLPLVLIPAWQWIYRAPRREKYAFSAALLLYCAAKLAELADQAIFDTLGFASGHTLKHLLATAAAAIIVGALIRRVALPAAGSENDDHHRARNDQRAAKRHLPGQPLAREHDAQHDRHRDTQLVDRRHLADRPELQRAVVAQPRQPRCDP
jgi:hypothetical protein